MTIMQHDIEIARPPEQVLAYASSATRWPEWHPSSLKVDAISGPLPAGSHFEEDIHAGGRPGHLSWDVVEYIPGQRWQASARGDRHGLQLVVTYECRATASGTHFVRTLEYGFPSVLMRVVNRLILRRRIERESAESLRILRKVAEQVIAPESSH